MPEYMFRAPFQAILFALALATVSVADAAEPSSETVSAPLQSYLVIESSGDSSGGQNYKLDLDHALVSGNRLLAVAAHSVVSTATQQFQGTALKIGFGTNSAERWSHRGTYEYASMGENLDSHGLTYALNWNSEQWGVTFTPELGRIGVFAGTPVTRVDIDRVGAKLDVNYYTDGPWRFLVSAAGNNFYGDASSIPAFIIIVRYTSAGLFITNFYKSRYGAEIGYSLERGSIAIGAEQVLTGSVLTNSLYFSAEGSLSDSLSLRSEFGQSFSGTTGWYGTMGIVYTY